MPKDTNWIDDAEDIIKGACPYCSHPKVTFDGFIQPDTDDGYNLIRYQQCKNCHERWEVRYVPDSRVVK